VENTSFLTPIIITALLSLSLSLPIYVSLSLSLSLSPVCSSKRTKRTSIHVPQTNQTNTTFGAKNWGKLFNQNSKKPEFSFSGYKEKQRHRQYVSLHCDTIHYDDHRTDNGKALI
jgi:hypothetical protein